MIPQASRPFIPFGKYFLRDRIAIGSMAEVWRAKVFGESGVERIVAIKRLLPHLADDKESITTFIDEARIVVQLTHAHIAHLCEMGQMAGSFYMAMEYVAGTDLRALFDHANRMGEPLPIPLVASCVSKLCDALHYVHFKKDTSGKDLHIVHRGLCLQDVLISFEGELKVVDFGLARAFMRATQTQPGIIKGKRGYMSPEQVRGLPVDRRSDIFSIGICFYELLTGKRLFEADSDAVYFEKVRKAEVPPPSQYNRHIPPPLEKIILKALARDVDARYQYASELSGDLKPFCTALQPGVDRERHFSPDDGAAFGRKSLAQYMQFAFAKEVEREKQRMADFATLQPPGSQGNE